MNLVVSFVIGSLAGLLLRPVLDAYLFWRLADLFRRESPASKSADERDDHRTGV